jgi:hypothetical protein
MNRRVKAQNSVIETLGGPRAKNFQTRGEMNGISLAKGGARGAPNAPQEISSGFLPRLILFVD